MVVEMRIGMIVEVVQPFLIMPLFYAETLGMRHYPKGTQFKCVKTDRSCVPYGMQMIHNGKLLPNKYGKMNVRG